MTAADVGTITATVFYRSRSAEPTMPRELAEAQLGAADRRLAHGLRPREDAIAECQEGYARRMGELAGTAEPGAQG